MTDKEFFPSIIDKAAMRAVMDWCDESHILAKENFDAVCEACPTGSMPPPAAIVCTLYTLLVRDDGMSNEDAQRAVKMFLRGFYLQELMAIETRKRNSAV